MTFDGHGKDGSRKIAMPDGLGGPHDAPEQPPGTGSLGITMGSLRPQLPAIEVSTMTKETHIAATTKPAAARSLQSTLERAETVFIATPPFLDGLSAIGGANRARILLYYRIVWPWSVGVSRCRNVAAGISIFFEDDLYEGLEFGREWQDRPSRGVTE